MKKYEVRGKLNKTFGGYEIYDKFVEYAMTYFDTVYDIKKD